MNLFQHATMPNIPNKPFSTAEKIAWIRLIRTENVGPVTFYKLIERFGSASIALDNLPSLSKRGGRAKSLNPAPLDQAQRELDMLHKLGGDMICACEERYPLALSAISDAPPVISVLGQPDLLAKQGIGIVGARNASINGRKFAQNLARDLGKAGQIVTSGLARGIDTSAHNGALGTGTIAVVAGGIDIVYPEENQALYDQIKETGCIVAESPLSQKPFAQSFPKRNRIISGLSSGVVVVEASLRSGSLITARLAGEQGRDVFAVPGFPADPRAGGPNKLLSDGAILVQSVEDILNHTNSFISSTPKSFHDSALQTFNPAGSEETYEQDENIIENAQDAIIAKLSNTPTQLDEILRDTGLSPAAFNSALLDLEIAGRITRHSGGRISLLR